MGVYRAAVIDSQLALAARNFVNQEVTLDGGRVRCSRIFKWYGGDFGSARMLAEFLRTHLDEGPVRAALAARAVATAGIERLRIELFLQ